MDSELDTTGRSGNPSERVGFNVIQPRRNIIDSDQTKRSVPCCLAGQTGRLSVLSLGPAFNM